MDTQDKVGQGDAQLKAQVPGGGESSPRIAVLVPCYNEELTIGKVVDDFRRELPEATVYVYDNASTDATARIAAEHGAVVRGESRRGKGNVTRQMFRDIEADVYVMVDGDDTYPAEDARALVAPIASGEADMAIGDRLSNGRYGEQNTRAGHGMGNALVCALVNGLYHGGITDIMTGYRAMSRVFVKGYPVVGGGFEVETEMSVHALDKGFRVTQVPVGYRDRPAGSQSKLDTVGDGALVLRTIASLFREYRPMRFFGTLSVLFLVACLACGIPVLHEFALTAYITHVPLAIAAVGCAVICVLFFMTGLILDSVARSARKRYELYMYSVYEEDRNYGGWHGQQL